MHVARAQPESVALYTLRPAAAYTAQGYPVLCSKHRPVLDNAFFVTNTQHRSSSDQFFCFINIAAWMLNTFASVDIGPVQEGDDPAAAIRTLLASLSKLGFTVPPSLTVSRLQTGAGTEVCMVLDGLADWSLEAAAFVLEQPVHASADDDGYARCSDSPGASGDAYLTSA